MHDFADNIDFLLLNTGYAEPNDRWNWSKVCSPFARIYHVTAGGARTRIDGREYELTPGNLYLTPPFARHDDESSGPFALRYIHFCEKIYFGRSLFDRLECPVAISAGPLDGMLIDRLLYINPDRELTQIDPGVYDNMATFSRCVADNDHLPGHLFLENRGILCYLVSRFLHNATPRVKHKDERLNRCLDYIHGNMDSDITIGQLSDISCVSPDHLTRIFRREVGCTPVRYINQKKIERAQLLLLTTNMPVTEIALELSLGSVSYFSRLFRKFTGVAPGHYRQINSGPAPSLNSAG